MDLLIIGNDERPSNVAEDMINKQREPLMKVRIGETFRWSRLDALDL